MSEPLTDEQLAALRAQAPVGFYCDHSDEPHTASSHHEWVWVDGQGLVFQHVPDVVKALAGPTDYLGPERAAQRCPRTVPVYAVDVPGLLSEVDRLREALTAISEERERLRDLIGDLADSDPCWFDHHSGCQAHGYLSLKPGERCPQAIARELLSAREVTK